MTESRCPTCGGSDQAFEDGRSFERGVLRERVARLRIPNAAEHQTASAYNDALADVLAALGVAPTTPEPPDREALKARLAARCADPDGFDRAALDAASLPSHDQEQPG